MSLWQDLRLAVRLLVKAKWFTPVAALALALGIGANTTVFTFANAVVLRGVPFTDPDSIVSIAMTDARGRQLGVSRLDFLDWRDSTRAFSHLAVLTRPSLNVSEQGRPAEQHNGTYGSANLFELVGQRPQLGRDFSLRTTRHEALFRAAVSRQLRREELECNEPNRLRCIWVMDVTNARPD